MGWKRLICRARGRKVDVQKLEEEYEFSVEMIRECGKI